jgi:hypothetical protein
VADWILLNGAKVDRARFEANLDLAYEQDWEKANADKPGTCLICEGKIPQSSVAYVSPRAVLCAPCFERFVGPSTPP